MKLVYMLLCLQVFFWCAASLAEGPELRLATSVADPAMFWVGPGLPQIPDDQGNGTL
jgi:hypothetical protein